VIFGQRFIVGRSAESELTNAPCSSLEAVAALRKTFEIFALAVR
jgi:hypothetical protein